MSIPKTGLVFLIVTLIIPIASACPYEYGHYTEIEILSSMTGAPVENTTIIATIEEPIYEKSYFREGVVIYTGQGTRTNTQGGATFLFYSMVKYKINIGGKYTLFIYPDESKYVIWV